MEKNAARSRKAGSKAKKGDLQMQLINWLPGMLTPSEQR